MQLTAASVLVRCTCRGLLFETSSRAEPLSKDRAAGGGCDLWCDGADAAL